MPTSDIKGSSVTLYTWGTHLDGGNGMAHFLDASFFGGNVGHAAIEITLPANAKTEQLIQQYCLKDNKKVIPFERTTQNAIDESLQVKKQDVYKIYFSWWPGKENGFDLRKNINTDNEHERIGVDAGKIDSRYDLPPREQRTYHGPLGSRTVNLANKEIAHLTSLTPDQKALIKIQRQLNESNDKLEALVILEKKLSTDKPLKVEGSLLSLLQQLDHWQANVKNVNTLGKEDIEELKIDLQDKKQAIAELQDILMTKRDILKETMQLEGNEKIKNEITTLSTLPENERLLLQEKYDKRFSAQAWIQYELEEVTRDLVPAQSVSIFCQMRLFEEKKETMLAILFDQNYPPDLKDTNNIAKWRQFLPEVHKHIERDAMTKDIYEQLQKNAKQQKDRLFNKQIALFAKKQLVDKVDPFLQGDHQAHVTRGHSPDDTLQIPGMNIQRMLAKMRSFTEDGKQFNLATKNCSATTGAILAAGAEPALKTYFKQKAWGGFGNPQEVLKGAIEYQHTVIALDGKKTFGEMLSAWNPLHAVSWLGGKMLNTIAQPTTSVTGKIALGVGLLPMAGLAAVTETLKAVVNPKKTFQRCSQFVKYAWGNNSIFLKLCSIPAALLSATMAIPALLQHGVQKAIIEPLTQTTFDRAALLERQKQPEPLLKRVKLSKDKLVEVDDPNPVVALATLQQLLHEHPDKIPMFSSKTQLNVNNYLKHLNKADPKQVEMMQNYEKTVKDIYSKANENALPPQRFTPEDHPRQDNPRHDALNAFARHAEQHNSNPEVIPTTDQPPSSTTSQRPE